MRWLVIIFVAVLALSQARASSATCLASAAVHVKKVANPQDIRYLDLSSIPEDYRKEVLQVLTFQFNSLSTEPDFAVPKVITAELLAINLLDYDEGGRWKIVWERLQNIEPYMHESYSEDWPGGFDKRFNKSFPAGKYTVRRAIPPYKGSQQDLDDLIHYTHSQVPIIRADFLFVQMARNLNLRNQDSLTGYYSWLGVKNRADFEKLVAFKEADSIRLKKEIRAAVKNSGVATQNRGIVRFQSLTGGYWVTLDTNDSTGKGNVVENPGRGEATHLAEEIYGVLPNGLFAFFLCTNEGVKQDTAPDFIGPDDSPLRSGRDGRIHVGLSCIRCHDGSGLRDITDFFRSVMRTPLAFQTPDEKKAREIRKQYFSNLQLSLDMDRRFYIDSLKSCNGMTSPENAKAFSKFWDFYIAGVDAEIASREYGVTEEYLLKCLKDYATATGQINLTISGLLANPQDKIRRDQYEEIQGILRTIIK